MSDHSRDALRVAYRDFPRSHHSELRDYSMCDVKFLSQSTGVHSAQLDVQIESRLISVLLQNKVVNISVKEKQKKDNKRTDTISMSRISSSSNLSKQCNLSSIIRVLESSYSDDSAYCAKQFH